MVYFGTIEGPLAQMQEVACMSTPLTTTHSGFVAPIQFENGGGSIVRSADSQKSYALTYQGHVDDSHSIDTIMEYYNGEYGDGYLYMTDPALIELGANLFRRNWATPAIIGNHLNPSYKPIHPGHGSSAPVTGGYGAPNIAATFTNLSTGQSGRMFTIPVPENYTLHIGWRGSISGNIEFALYSDSVYIGDIVPSTIGSDGLYTDSIAGPTIAQFKIRQTSSGAGLLTMQSADAILLPTGETAPSVGNHQRGQGVSGMRFSSSSIPYEYVNAERGIRSFSVELVETEEWSYAYWD